VSRGQLIAVLSPWATREVADARWQHKHLMKLCPGMERGSISGLVVNRSLSELVNRSLLGLVANRSLSALMNRLTRALSTQGQLVGSRSEHSMRLVGLFDGIWVTAVTSAQRLAPLASAQEDAALDPA
jgi:hypothetical protein